MNENASEGVDPQTNETVASSTLAKRPFWASLLAFVGWYLFVLLLLGILLQFIGFRMAELHGATQALLYAFPTPAAFLLARKKRNVRALIGSLLILASVALVPIGAFFAHQVGSPFRFVQVLFIALGLWGFGTKLLDTKEQLKDSNEKLPSPSDSAAEQNVAPGETGAK